MEDESHGPNNGILEPIWMKRQSEPGVPRNRKTINHSVHYPSSTPRIEVFLPQPSMRHISITGSATHYVFKIVTTPSPQFPHLRQP